LNWGFWTSAGSDGRMLLLQGVHFLFVLKAYQISCIVSLPMDHKYKDRERLICTLYLVNKFVDLVETIFFVLRKKDRQISFLHVFHHFAMAFFGYLYYCFHGYGGVAFPQCLLNTAVHVIMYAYYYLSSISKEVQRSLWWKKYITIAQLVQFAIILLHCTITLAQPNCAVNRPLTYGCGSLSAFFAVIFSQFYYHNYIKPGKKSAKQNKN